MYLTKAGICLCVLYGFYKWLFAGSTLFGFNRRLLLWGVAVCLCMPLVPWTVERESPVQRPLRVWNEKLAEAWPESGSDGGAETTLGRELPACGDEAAGWAVVPVVYCTGTVCMLLFWILGYVRVWRLVKCGTCRREKKWTEVWTDEPVGAFCVGRWLVMNRADYRDFPLIRLHELMHIRYRHTWDECLMQGLVTLFWFHPVAWLLRKELREVHEYQADEGVLGQGIDAKTYQMLLVRKAVGAKKYAMASGFLHCSLKKRVVMMLRKRTNRWRRLALLWAIPLAGGTAWLFARPEMNVEWLQEKTADVETAGEAPTDTVGQERRYVEVEDGPNVYDVYINHRGKVFFDPLGNRYGRKGEIMMPEQVQEIMSASLVKHFAQLQNAFKAGKRFTVQITTRVETKKEDLQAVEHSVQEAVRMAVAELSHSYRPEDVQDLLKLNMAYNKPRTFKWIP